MFSVGFSATVTISLPPEMNTITVNKTHFVHCVASYEPQLDVTYYWYHSGRLIDFEIIYRLGENRYEIWRNPHYKRVSSHDSFFLFFKKTTCKITGFPPIREIMEMR